MRYLSVCSGIEAATVAWHPLGWTPVAFSEIEAFPSAVLAHHYPNVPNYGDMTQHEQWPIERGAVDLLVGGTPCQSFSVAGLRKGLKDPRGGLMLTYLEIAQRLQPRWVVWENVPGVLSSNGGWDFGSFLGALGDLGYGWAYRVLDAQWCRTHRHPRAVPQRRRRVFVVGCLGDGDAAAAVLFERESVQRNPAARRTPGQGTAANAEAGAGAGCYWNGEQITAPINRQNRQPGDPCHTLARDNAAHAAIAIQGNLVGRDTGGPHGVGASEEGAMYTLTKADTHAVAFTRCDNGQDAALDHTPTMRCGSNYSAHLAVAFDWQSGGDSRGLDPKDTAQLQRCQVPAVAHAHFQDSQFGCKEYDSAAIRAGRIPEHSMVVNQAMTVRRLTPRECERLQGFPDDYTAIPWRGKAETPDGPRYRALGNSMAVNCMAWIGERIAAWEAR